MNYLLKSKQQFDSWIMRPSQYASKHICLARIVYAVFVLWFMSMVDFVELARIPDAHIYIRSLKFRYDISSFELMLIEQVLIFALCMLVLGFYTRIATLFVLVIGFCMGITYFSNLGGDQTLMIPFFIIPVCTLFSRWGDYFSIDSLLRNKRKKHPPNDSWLYIWPARLALIILSILFFSAGYHKAFLTGTWLSNPKYLSHFFLIKPIESYIRNGTPINSLSYYIGNTSILSLSIQYFVLLFELSFPLALIHHRLSSICLRIAMAFHALNAILLGIPFILVLPFYILFVNWYVVLLHIPRMEIYLNKLTQGITSHSLRSIKIIAFLCSLIIAMTWNAIPLSRWLFSLGGLLDGNTAIWIALLPFICIWIIRFRKGIGIFEWNNSKNA